MAEKSKMELIKEFIETCPYLNKGKIDVDYLKGDVNKKREEINKAKAQTPREVNLIGLKNRNGKSYFKCSYKFYPAFNFFEEVETLEED